MTRVFLGLAACVLGLALAGNAQAYPRASVGHHPSGRAYYHDHGVRFAGGYYYRGAHHSHWSRHVWSPVYHRYHYWDPYINCYYFYDPVRIGYYPCH